MLKSSYQAELMEAGCDEAGRGCLAGPVFAAAVILPPDFSHSVLTDSKQLSEKKRYQLRKEIEENAIAWAVESSDNHFIDQHNILKASILTMHKISIDPELRKSLVEKGQMQCHKFSWDSAAEKLWISIEKCLS